MKPVSRSANVQDVHRLAKAMPYVSAQSASAENPVYQVGGKSFIFFRNPRPDAVDAATGQRYDDVIVFWVLDESDKQAMVQDEGTPYFTTSHFEGHPSVLVRASRIGELTYAELAQVVEDAWLSRVSKRRRAEWLTANPPSVGPVPLATGNCRPVREPKKYNGPISEMADDLTSYGRE